MQARRDKNRHFAGIALLTFLWVCALFPCALHSLLPGVGPLSWLCGEAGGPVRVTVLLLSFVPVLSRSGLSWLHIPALIAVVFLAMASGAPLVSWPLFSGLVLCGKAVVLAWLVHVYCSEVRRMHGGGGV